MNLMAPAIVGSVAVLAVGMVSHGREYARTADSLPDPVQAENSLTGDLDWTMAPPAPAGAIDGYTSEVSAFPGGIVHFHVSTSPSARYRIVVYRLGWYGGIGARRVACLPSCDGDEQGEAQIVPPPNASTGTLDLPWPVTDALTIGRTWVSGYYLAELILGSGDNAGSSTRVPFIVNPAPDPAAPSSILAIVPVNTWEAYNNWGGKSLYDFNSGGHAATHVSFNRPYVMNGASLVSIFANEYPYVRYFEKQGYDISYTTSVDVQRDPDQLMRHRLVVDLGHDEYWTREQRSALEDALASGTNLAFLGANEGYWQARYEDAERTLVEYRSNSDPIADRGARTVTFDALGRPECELLGNGYVGGEDQTDNDAPRGFSVNPSSLSDPWFAGTGFTASSTLPGLVGYEWNTLQPLCAVPTPEVIFHYQGSPANSDAVKYVAPSGARVFSAGTLQLGWGLDAFTSSTAWVSAPLVAFFRNMLDDLTRPAAPTAVSAELVAGGTQLTATTHDDPRLTGVRFLRHKGVADFAAADATPVPGCAANSLSCLDSSAPGHRTYRYAAVAVDRWGASQPALSGPVTLPDSPPTVQLSGPRSIPARRRITITAAATDRDGDHLTFAWQIDGGARLVRGRTIHLSFRSPGRHHVKVTVVDRYSESASVELILTIRHRA